MTDCRIYVACLASYNNGHLHGQWIDVDGKDSDDIYAEVNAMLKDSKYPNVSRRQCLTCDHIQDDRGQDDSCDICGGYIGPAFPSAEEWAIHDHEGFSNMISEYTSFDDIAAIAEALSGDYAIGFAYLVDNLNMSPSEAASQADSVCIHQTDAMDIEKDYAEDMVEDNFDMSGIPQLIRDNIDYSGIAIDLANEGVTCKFTHNGETVLITNANGF